MNKWIAEFDLEDGDIMPEHMDLEYKGAKLDFHCRPKEPIFDKIKAEIEKERSFQRAIDEYDIATGLRKALEIIDKYKAESEGNK